MSRRSQRLSPVLVLACVGITVLHEASPQPKQVLEGHEKDPTVTAGEPDPTATSTAQELLFPTAAASGSLCPVCSLPRMWLMAHR